MFHLAVAAIQLPVTCLLNHPCEPEEEEGDEEEEGEEEEVYGDYEADEDLTPTPSPTGFVGNDASFRNRRECIAFKIDFTSPSINENGLRLNYVGDNALSGL